MCCEATRFPDIFGVWGLRFQVDIL